MRVILLEELKGKGREGDVVDVARGFAVNYLFPRRLAVQATRGNLKQLDSRRSNIETRESAKRNDAQSLAAALEGKAVRISAKAGEEGKLYGSVTAHMIADAIAEQLGVEVDRRRLDVSQHIKTLGSHEVSLHVYHDVNATMTVNVVADGAPQVPGPTAREVLETETAEEDAALQRAMDQAAEAPSETAFDAAEGPGPDESDEQHAQETPEFGEEQPSEESPEAEE